MREQLLEICPMCGCPFQPRPVGMVIVEVHLTNGKTLYYHEACCPFVSINRYVVEEMPAMEGFVISGRLKG